MTPEIKAQVAVWRAKALDQTLTVDELKAAVALLREGRTSAAQVATTGVKRKKGKPAVVDMEMMEKELGI